MIPLQDTLDLVEMSGNSLCEYSIKSSARSFQILSNSLYKNKIRAIIRELSTNAYDSHVACGKKDVPFYIHFPTTLEPYFAIQDYGTGLSIEDIKNIYTVYFESTKTNTNNQIGELGLGCKSPFSYTKNFTITSIHNNIKSVYTAFINDRGVPDITLMYQDETDESNGLTVQFAVNNNNDFRTFLTEAKYVYSYFPYTPNSNIEFTPYTRQYYIKDIIPGGHVSHNNSQTAIMGLIPYPIEIDSYNDRFAQVRYLLTCNIELHFSIGELDIQPSREGLSYIPQTVDAIYNKLNEFHNALVLRIETEANAIDNLWERAIFLQNKKNSSYYLYSTPISAYCTKYSFDLLNKSLSFDKKVLQEQYNLSVTVLRKNSNRIACSTLFSHQDYIDITIKNNVHFILNNLKTKAITRTKYHYNKIKSDEYKQYYIYILELFDKTLKPKYDEFFKEILNPPKSCIINASELLESPKKQRSYNKNVSILRLAYTPRSELIWVDTQLSDLPIDTTHYYVSLNGYTMISNYGFTSAKTLFNLIENCNSINFNIPNLYGVRKSDLETIQSMSNWINYETFIVEQLDNISDSKIKYMARALCNIDSYAYTEVANLVSDTSFYKTVADELNNHTFVSYIYQLLPIINQFHPTLFNRIEELKEQYVKMFQVFEDRYPLIKYMASETPHNKIADYVILIDSIKENM